MPDSAMLSANRRTVPYSVAVLSRCGPKSSHVLTIMLCL